MLNFDQIHRVVRNGATVAGAIELKNKLHTLTTRYFAPLIVNCASNYPGTLNEDWGTPDVCSAVLSFSLQQAMMQGGYVFEWNHKQ